MTLTPPSRGRSRLRLGLVCGLRSEFAGEPHLHDEWDTPTGMERIATVLERDYEVVPIVYDARFRWIEAVRGCDVVWSLAEGVRGPLREALVSAVLDQLRVPSIGSPSGTLAVCMDKRLAKLVVERVGVAVAREVDRGPAVLKPRCEGSSQWIEVCREDGAPLHDRLREQEHATGRPFFAEELLTGREFTIAVLGDVQRPGGGWIGVAELDFDALGGGLIYDHAHKHNVEEGPLANFYRPLDGENALEATLASLGRRLAAALDVRDFGRFDVRMRTPEPDSAICFLEANPLPGLVDVPGWMSDFPFIFSRQMTYDTMLRRLTAAGVQRLFPAAGLTDGDP